MTCRVCATRSYDRFSDQVRLDALTRVIPAAVIADVAACHQHQFTRPRQFDVRSLLWLLTAHISLLPKACPGC